jgi:hypothetical protein
LDESKINGGGRNLFRIDPNKREYSNMKVVIVHSGEREDEINAIRNILGEKLIKFSNTFKVLEEIKDCFASRTSRLFISEKGELISINPRSFVVENSDGDTIIYIRFDKSQYKYKYEMYKYIYDGNNVYIKLRDGNYICTENPDTDWENNLYKIRDPLETKNKLIAAKKRYLEGASDELYMDEKNRLFKGNKFITRDYQKFINYWTEKHEQDNKLMQELQYHKIELPEGLKFNEIKNLRYLGEDNDENIYWGYWKHHILIFDKDGWCIEGIDYDRDKTKCLPTIHPNGDVYFLDYDAEGVYLYKITRCW